MTKSQKSLIKRNALLSIVASLIYVIIKQVVPDYKATYKKWLGITHGTMVMSGTYGKITPLKVIYFTAVENNYSNLKKWLKTLLIVASIVFAALFIISRFTKRK
jgi:uncharacterized protein YacL